jgi:hypothetical protein
MAAIPKNLCLRRVEFGEIGAYFSPPQCKAGHKCKKFFEGRSEEAKEMAISDETQFCEARNMAKTELVLGDFAGFARPPKPEVSSSDATSGRRRSGSAGCGRVEIGDLAPCM